MLTRIDLRRFKCFETLKLLLRPLTLLSDALFSDSSDQEKRRFRETLTFPHPGEPESPLFCPWHGKVRHMTLRLHFSRPVRAGRPVYVVYAGPKLTKR